MCTYVRGIFNAVRVYEGRFEICAFVWRVALMTCTDIRGVFNEKHGRWRTSQVLLLAGRYGVASGARAYRASARHAESTDRGGACCCRGTQLAGFRSYPRNCGMRLERIPTL